MLLAIIVIAGIGKVSAQNTSSTNPLNTNGTEGVFTAAEDLEWYYPMEGAPIQFAVASGSTFETAHSTFGKFPGNFITPVHIHSNSYQAVVISGVMTNPMASEKGNPVKMGPGPYWYVPGNEAHQTACISVEPCVFYMYQPVPFDFTPVDQISDNKMHK